MPGEGKPKQRKPVVGLQIKLPIASTDDLKLRHADDLSQGVFFVRTRSPKPVGTLVRFDLRLSNGAAALGGVGIVKSVSPEADFPDRPGMLLKLRALDEASQQLMTGFGYALGLQTIGSGATEGASSPSADQAEDSNAGSAHADPPPVPRIPPIPSRPAPASRTFEGARSAPASMTPPATEPVVTTSRRAPIVGPASPQEREPSFYPPIAVPRAPPQNETGPHGEPPTARQLLRSRAAASAASRLGVTPTVTPKKPSVAPRISVRPLEPTTKPKPEVSVTIARPLEKPGTKPLPAAGRTATSVPAGAAAQLPSNRSLSKAPTLRPATAPPPPRGEATPAAGKPTPPNRFGSPPPPPRDVESKPLRARETPLARAPAPPAPERRDVTPAPARTEERPLARAPTRPVPEPRAATPAPRSEDRPLAKTPTRFSVPPPATTSSSEERPAARTPARATPEPKAPTAAAVRAESPPFARAPARFDREPPVEAPPPDPVEEQLDEVPAAGDPEQQEQLPEPERQELEAEALPVQDQAYEEQTPERIEEEPLVGYPSSDDEPLPAEQVEDEPMAEAPAAEAQDFEAAQDFETPPAEPLEDEPPAGVTTDQETESGAAPIEPVEEAAVAETQAVDAPPPDEPPVRVEDEPAAPAPSAATPTTAPPEPVRPAASNEERPATPPLSDAARRLKEMAARSARPGANRRPPAGDAPPPRQEPLIQKPLEQRTPGAIPAGDATSQEAALAALLFNAPPPRRSAEDDGAAVHQPTAVR